MAKIEIEIENCSKCPHFYTGNQYSTDGWDRMEDWMCKKADRKIRGSVEWHEEKGIKIPDWCPSMVKPDRCTCIDNTDLYGVTKLYCSKCHKEVNELRITEKI